MKLWPILASYSIVCATLLFIYWRGNYQNKKKFVVLLSVISTISGVIFGTAVIFEILNYNKTRTGLEIDYYNQFSTLLFDDTFTLFIQYPEMNYYYNDLNGIKLIDKHTTRNYVLEHQISMLIFSRMSKIANFSEYNNDMPIGQSIEKWMEHIISTFMKSPTLRHYWTNYYKPKLSGPVMLKFMEEKFNI